jgi:hypothetical protein
MKCTVPGTRDCQNPVVKYFVVDLSLDSDESLTFITRSCGKHLNNLFPTNIYQEISFEDSIIWDIMAL